MRGPGVYLNLDFINIEKHGQVFIFISVTSDLSVNSFFLKQYWGLDGQCELTHFLSFPQGTHYRCEKK